MPNNNFARSAACASEQIFIYCRDDESGVTALSFIFGILLR